MNSRSWDYKTGFYIYNTNNRLILARHVGWDMRSSCFWQVIIETITGNQWNNTSLAAKGALARFLGILSNFRKIRFLIRALLLWEKVTVESGEEEEEETDENSGH